MNTPFFSSPLGPLHSSHPSQMTSFVIPLPSSSRIRSFFRSSSSSPASSKDHKPNQPQKSKKEKLQVEYDQRKGGNSTFTPLEKETSPPPPSYRQAIEEDLYYEDIIAVENVGGERERILMEEHRRMSEGLKSLGF